jgi:hypothetical protein
MKIEYVNRKTVKFEDLEIGQVFCYPNAKDVVCVKMRDGYKIGADTKAACLTDGRIYKSEPCTMVLPLNATLKVEN